MFKAHTALDVAHDAGTLSAITSAATCDDPVAATDLPLDVRMRVAQSLVPIVAQAFGVTVGQVCRRTRGRAKTAFARQVAMYLANTTCSLTFTDVGKLFGRDRTTVSHGCSLVEEYRDDPQFDEIVELLECAARARLTMATSPMVSAFLVAGPLVAGNFVAGNLVAAEVPTADLAHPFMASIPANDVRSLSA